MRALFRKHFKKILILLLLIAFFIYFYSNYDLDFFLKKILIYIQDLGTKGVILFILAYILATIFFLPGSLLTLGAGAIFGLFWGTVYASIASTTGAFLACYLGRGLLRNKIEKKIADNRKFRAIDSAIEKEGWKIVFLTRLSPVFPFNLLNYAYGLTKIKLTHYVIASWVGMIPGTILYVYLGSFTTNLAKLGITKDSETGYTIVFRAIGLVATALVTIYVTNISKKALKKKI